MRVVAIVHARMSSRRLPGKILRQMCGKPMVQYLLERLQCCLQINSWLLATSTDPGDDPVEKFAHQNEFPVFRGPLDDVATRVIQAADVNNADAVVRLSGDSPFLDQAVIDRGAELFRTGEFDLVTNVRPRTYPPGCSVEVVGVETLRAAAESMPEEEKEHVIRALYADPNLRIHNYEHTNDLSDTRLTVDTQDEFLVAEQIIGSMTRPHTEYNIDDVVELCHAA